MSEYVVNSAAEAIHHCINQLDEVESTGFIIFWAINKHSELNPAGAEFQQRPITIR
jgi:hypothetical protein